MILDNNDKKTSAYRKAKELIGDRMEALFYVLEINPDNTKKMTEKEQAEILRHINNIIIRLETCIFGRK